MAATRCWHWWSILEQPFPLHERTFKFFVECSVATGSEGKLNELNSLAYEAAAMCR
jgi:hypothetical protein